MEFRHRMSRAAALLAALVLGGAHAAPLTRSVTPLTQDWRFAFGEQPAVAAGEQGWQTVSLPHSWNRVGGHASKAADADERQGKAWYRLHFQAPASASAPRRSWLQFDGASIVSEVWLNGVALGRHAGAVSGFRFDVTDAIRAGDNQLLVSTDNSAPDKKGSVTAETLPMGGDWFMYGGLYRPVSLMTTAPLHIDLADHGGPGVYARTLAVEAGQAQIEVITRLRNDGGAPQTASVRTALRDAQGTVVAATTRKLAVAASAPGSVRTVLQVKQPHLWDGIADPYRYSVQVDVLVQGQRIDQVTQPLGIRTMRFDPERGFFLNGKHLALRGVNRHQESGANGWATTAAELARDYAIIRDIGANTVRLAHYQHAQAEYDLADRMGLIVWAEMPLVLMSAPHGAAAATPGFIANAEQHLRELIRQNYNHPSIAVWSIANEPNIANVWMPLKSQTLPLLQRLAALARAEDPSRLPVLASCCGTLPGDLMPGMPGQGLDSPPEAVDVLGLNVYFGWYYADVAALTPYLKQVHDHYPNKALSVTEYGAGGALSQHTDNPLGGPVDMGGRPHPEGFQSFIHEKTWPQLRDAPFLWGSWIWNMFDFGSAERQEGDLVNTNDKGIVSFDRTVRKESFYFYKAHWNPEPMIYLAGHRYTERASPVAEVRAYSNAPRARLSVNGKDLGSVDCVERICVWPQVTLAKGDNTMLVEATVGQQKLSDQAVWHRAAGHDTYNILAGQLTVTATNAGWYGSDNFFSGGQGQFLNRPVRGTPPPPKIVAGATDQKLYLTYRTGQFSYELPLPNGDYDLTLRFIEPEAGKAPGQRIFDVLVQGQVALPDLDLAARAGAMRAVEHSVRLQVSDGKARFAFVPKVGAALLSSFSISPR